MGFSSLVTDNEKWWKTETNNTHHSKDGAMRHAMQCHACTVQYSTVPTSFTTSNDREKLRIMQINTETSLWESIVTVGFRDCETSRRFVPSSNTFPASSGHYFFGCLNLLLNTRHGFMFCINHQISDGLFPRELFLLRTLKSQSITLTLIYI